MPLLNPFQLRRLLLIVRQRSETGDGYAVWIKTPATINDDHAGICLHDRISREDADEYVADYNQQLNSIL